MTGIIYLYIFLFSFLSSIIFVKLSRNLAQRFNIVDQPDPRRKIHQHPIPLLGGIGIWLAFSLTILISIVFIFSLNKCGFLPKILQIHISGIKSTLPKIILILSTGLLLVVIGLVDDLKKLKAPLKLLFQFIVAMFVFLSGIRISLFIDNIFISALLTIIWIVGITNAFNLLDNMDGLSCGTAIISASIFFIIAASTGQFFVASILVCFIGTLLGFLKYNFPPASVFMGDAGSLFIGYTLSILTIVNTFYRESNPTPAPVIMPLLIMAVPIFDTCSVIYIRLKNKTSIFTADKNHFSHRLLNLGMSKRQALLFIYLVNFCIGLGALLLASLNLKGCLIILLQAVCIIAIIVLLEKVRKCSD